jgi:transposase-like protein
MARGGRRYSAKLKFQVVLEALRGEHTPGQLAKQYGVHANSIGIWKKQLLERGPEVFAQEGRTSETERRVADLERLLGQKEVEIALLKNFLGRSA